MLAPALEKGEGSVMGMFGGGKLGTKGNPMIVQFADGSSSANGGLLSGLFGGGSKGPGASRLGFSYELLSVIFGR